jgi:hypothetical protein
LETLTLEHNARNGKDTHLQLQLGNGLEHLATLKKLRFLVLLCFTQEFTTAEVQVSQLVPLFCLVCFTMVNPIPKLIVTRCSSLITHAS